MKKGQKLGRPFHIPDRDCRKCAKTYSPNATNQLYCFPCIKDKIGEYGRKYRAIHAKELSEQKRQHYLRHRDVYRARLNKWNKNNREKIRQYVARYVKKQREKAYEILAGDSVVRCVLFQQYGCCAGQTDWRILQLDHRNGRGRKHRLGLKSHIHKWIIDNPEEARKTLQIACANAQWIKRYEEHEVPPRGLKPEESVELNEKATISGGKVGG